MSDNKKSATKFPPDWEKNVQRMWRILREYDSNIPSDNLDLMRQILLDAKSPSQAQQPIEIGEGRHFAQPYPNLEPAHVEVFFSGKPPAHGTKVYAMSPAPEGEPK